MNELAINQRINLNEVNFYEATTFLRSCNQRSTRGVDWAEVFVSIEGRAIVVYKSGDRIKTHGAKGVEEVIEWFDDKIPGVRRDGTLTREYETKYRRSYQIDLDELMKRGGTKNEADKARLFINRVYDAAGGGYFLSRQRRAPFSYR